MPLDLQPIADATPLGPDELLGLRLAYVSTQDDLNAAEEANILDALAWTRRTRRKDLLSRDYVLTLHSRMFGKVWSWAGEWRRRETNIGVSPHTIPMRVEGLLQDVTFWVEHRTYAPVDTAVRFRHQLVSIHPFANGNGRHARLMADLLAVRLGEAALTWGRASLTDAGATRSAYIKALRKADAGEIDDLVAFARN